MIRIIQLLSPQPVVRTCVRHRYFSEKEPYVRHFGYEDKVAIRGLLPRSEEFGRIKQLPIYRPKDVWSRKRALKGQNDYIGDGRIHPTQISYGVPFWLKGFRGNEFQMLLRKRKMLGDHMMVTRPSKWREMNERIRRLHQFLNKKTKDVYWKRSYSISH